MNLCNPGGTGAASAIGNIMGSDVSASEKRFLFCTVTAIAMPQNVHLTLTEYRPVLLQNVFTAVPVLVRTAA